LFYSADLSFYVVQTLHHISILNIFLITYYFVRANNSYKFYNFLKFFAIFSIIIAILELIFNFRLPNTAIYFDGSVSAFNWNQNELGTALIAFVPLLLVFEQSKTFKMTLIFIFIFIFFINDSKLTLIGLIVGLFFYFLKNYILDLNKFIKVIFVLLVPFTISILIVLPYDQIIIPFKNYNISLDGLLIEPLKKIINLEPFPDFGASIQTRANAIIYGVIELKNSYFLGIGSGNSLLMLGKPEYSLKSAKSMHNLPIQLIVEHGIIILFLFIAIFINFVKLLYKQNLSKVKFILFISIPTIFIGSMSSSVGIFSNYFFLSSLFFIILLNLKKENKYA
jgi:teichuronic acid biosynthesis protein TuaE